MPRRRLRVPLVPCRIVMQRRPTWLVAGFAARWRRHEQGPIPVYFVDGTGTLDMTWIDWR